MCIVNNSRLDVLRMDVISFSANKITFLIENEHQISILITLTENNHNI